MLLLADLIFIAALPAGQAASPVAPQEREALGRNLTIEKGETTSDVVCKFCSILVRGTVKGDAVALWGSVEVSGAVEGDIVAVGGGVRLAPQASVEGDAIAIGGSVERGKDTHLAGEVTAMPWFALPGQRSLHLPGALGNLGVSLLAASLFYVAARPKRIERMAETLRNHYVLAGFAGALLFVLAIALLTVRIHVRHASEIKDYAVLLALAVIAGLGWTAASREAGRRVAGQFRPLVATLCGATAITVLSLIPFLGLIVALLVTLVALGIPLTSVVGKAAARRPFARRQADPPASLAG